MQKENFPQVPQRRTPKKDSPQAPPKKGKHHKKEKTGEQKIKKEGPANPDPPLVKLRALHPECYFLSEEREQNTRSNC